ncbi:DUF4339 domain-containing protein [Pseudomonas sp. MAFF 311095]|uniref:DUF4339 domain-containing protein n=1 Tax=Pseudomonas petroselini TaxID=2899822 RepID=UPI001E65479B|nr:DUF4339 domain-containing protein [Pseudomonas petroselini]MCD7046656.1 DUF4339 domain-containing protein [Pseudomonas petroselini]MCD7068821.1 DUF4339 domain-containing protein [Pseudomonas petroselini]MCD7079232.1 DUF4339 domain-containing protein [Pseudomonas petroselini]
MNDTQWFYEDRGERVGPFAEQEIKNLIRANKIGRGTLVWYTGMSKWMTIETSDLKQEFLATPPPLAGDRISDLWVWLIALTPIIFIGGQSRYLGAVATTVWLVNVGCCWWDITNLRKAGHKSPSIWWSFFWGLIFIYLYLRSRRLGKSQAPLVVWLSLILVAPLLFHMLQRSTF